MLSTFLAVIYESSNLTYFSFTKFKLQEYVEMYIWICSINSTSHFFKYKKQCFCQQMFRNVFKFVNRFSRVKRHAST